MERLNNDLDLLCSKLQSMILDELSMPNLASFAKTRMENDKGVKDYMDKCFGDMDHFLTLLDPWVWSGPNTLHVVQAKQQ